MTDNIKVKPEKGTTGVSVATDEVGSRHFPVYKPAFGIEGEEPAHVSSSNPLPVELGGESQIEVIGPTTSYGEVEVTEATPEVALQFPYNINPAQVIQFPGNGGSISDSNNEATVSSGTNSDGFALILSRDVVRYNPGQGGMARYSARFNAGQPNSEAIIGVGANLNGFFFGYNGADFGVLRRAGGQPEVRTLTITTPSTTDEDITITLDGDSDSTVTVTNSGDACITAREIAEHSFASLGVGWGATCAANRVIFISLDAAAHSGSYGMTATTAVGTYSQTIEGEPATDEWIEQSSWNGDTMDGNGNSGITLDPTKGNVYMVKYQWLGYGAISYFVENPSTGGFIKVHQINYANANTSPSVDNATFPMTAEVRNQGNTTDISISTSSMAGFTEGKQEVLGPNFSADRLFTLGNTTDETPILTIRNKQIYQGKINQVRITPLFITLVSNLATANANTTFRTYTNATPQGSCSYSDINANSSVVELDVTADDFDLGIALKQSTFILGSTESFTFDLTNTINKIAPGATFMITAQASQGNVSNEVGATINWKELF